MPLAAIGGIGELFVIGVAAAAFLYYGTLGLVLCVGLIYRRIRYGKGNW